MTSIDFRHFYAKNMLKNRNIFLPLHHIINRLVVKRIIGIFLFTCMTAFVCVSCLDNGETSLRLNYNIGVCNARFADNDSALVRSYLEAKNCPYAIVENIAGENLYDCDTLCAVKMRTYIQRLSAIELDSLPLSDSCRFRYAASRYAMPFGGTSELVYLGIFDYNKRKNQK